MSYDGGVWEATIATALRDSQWLAKSASAVSPEQYITLSSDAEQALGDTFFEAKDRYFLFELKGTRSRIKSEWERYVKSDGSRVVEPKRVHNVVMGLFDAWSSDIGQVSSKTNIIRSLCAHHFVYWDGFKGQDGSYASRIVVEPYIRATVDCLGDEKRDPSILDACFHPVFTDEEREAFYATRFIGASRFDLSSLNLSCAAIVELGQGARFDKIYQLGLPPQHFQKYISLLIGESEGCPIRAVVTNASGSFVRVITNTNDLAVIFDESPSNDPSRSLKIKPCLYDGRSLRRSEACQVPMPASYSIRGNKP